MKKTTFWQLFPNKKPLIGVIRLQSLAGYAKYPGLDKVITTALSDIKKLEKAGFDGALIDNHTHPHVITATKEMKQCFLSVMKALVKKTNLVLGVQVLLNDPKASLCIAKNSGAKFIRTDFFVDKVETEHGVMEIDPEGLISYKKKINAENILILADVHVKHAQMQEKKTLEKSIQQANDHQADGIIITGEWTGIAPKLTKLKKAKKEAKKHDLPVIIGSGFNAENSKQLLTVADGVLVGTAIRNGSRIGYSKAKKLIKVVKEEI